MSKSKKVLILICFFYIGKIQSQENTHASSGNASGSGGIINYSVGQLVFSDISDGTYTSSQGLQQAFEISNLLNLDIDQSTDSNIFVFPNPTTNYLNLSLNIDNSSKLTYQLFDSAGRLLLIKNNLKIHETISMEGLARAVYYLNISNNNLIKKTFKIIKN